MDLLNLIAEWLIVILVALSVYFELENLKANRATQAALQRLFESRERWYSSRNKKPPTRAEPEVEAVREMAAEAVTEPTTTE